MNAHLETREELEAIEATALRYAAVREIARAAGAEALALFRRRDELVIESKGLQDMVSAADRDIEALLRREITARFADDGFVGEEGGIDRADAAFLWVIDPIDGTACFVNGMHAWCLSVGVLHRGVPVIGVVYDPNSDELFHAAQGHGAWVNERAIRVADAATVRDGVLGVGFSHRVPVEAFVPFLGRVLAQGGMFIRNGSGALMLSYVAAGRLIGYYEPHINSWDCLAGIVLIEQAGGRVNDFFANDGLTLGNPIIAAAPALYGALLALTGHGAAQACVPAREFFDPALHTCADPDPELPRPWAAEPRRQN